MPISSLKEKLHEFIENLKIKILNQEKYKSFNEKYNNLKIEINKSRKITTTDEEWERICENKYNPEVSNLVSEFKDEISDILKDLEKIYKTIIESSSKIEDIFQYPLKIMNEKHRQEINIEKLHKKEFLKIIRNDSFFKSLIVEINKKDYNFFQDLRNLIRNYQDDITQTIVISDKDNSLDDSTNENFLSDDSCSDKYYNFSDFKSDFRKFNDFVKITVK